MFEADRMCGRSIDEGGMEQIGRELHALCQPLTTLQCGLELAGLIDTPEAYRAAVNAGLKECARVAERVRLMREIVRATIAEAEGGVPEGPFVPGCVPRNETQLRIP